jgi:hypothetical protein
MTRLGELLPFSAKLCTFVASAGPTASKTTYLYLMPKVLVALPGGRVWSDTHRPS